MSPTSTAKTVYRYRHNSISLTQSLNECATLTTMIPPNDFLWGLCYSPTACFWVKWKPNASNPLEILQHQSAWPRVYEARFFNAHLDLHWQAPTEDLQQGQAICLTEKSDIDQPPLDWMVIPELRALKTLQTDLLLAGDVLQADSQQKDWTWVSSARLGQLSVPMIASDPAQRFTLRSYEYIGLAPGSAGEDGNCTVIGERWYALVSASYRRIQNKTQEKRLAGD